jgi:hypothetical protein
MEPMSDFLKRVFQNLPQTPPSDYYFKIWNVSGKITSEALGILPVPGVEPEKLVACVMDVDHYVGNINYVAESRSISDGRYVQPKQVRFYQQVKIPLLGAVHQEIVLTDGGTIQGWRVVYWEMLDKETQALSPKVAIRNQYSDGAWVVKHNLVGYTLSTAPRREDVGFLKWQALTKGADVGASSVIKGNIEAMSRWAARS